MLNNKLFGEKTEIVKKNKKYSSVKQNNFNKCSQMFLIALSLVGNFCYKFK